LTCATVAAWTKSQDKPAVLLEGVTRRYGELTAVDDLSLEVGVGEIFGLLGPNGAGKSTLFKMLSGIARVDEGRLSVIGGKQCANCGHGHPCLGYVPQSLDIWPDLTMREQLDFVGALYEIPKARRQRNIAKLLERFALTAKADALASQLSGGMQRRLSMMLPLISDPFVLLLDEPQAGLDPQSRLLVRDILRQLAHEESTTVIIASHDIAEMEGLAQRVAILDHGRLLAVGTPAELKGSDGQAQVEIAPAAGQDGQAEAIYELAAELGLEPSVQVGRVLVRTDRGPQTLRAIVAALGERGLEPGSVRLRERSLEDVFIELTGRSLRE